MMRLLGTMETFLETKCSSWRLYLLDQLDRFKLPPELEGLQTVEIGPAKDNTAVADSQGTLDVHRKATTKLKCRLPICGHGLDQEGWLFVSRPAVEFEEGSTDPSVS